MVLEYYYCASTCFVIANHRRNSTNCRRSSGGMHGQTVPPGSIYGATLQAIARQPASEVLKRLRLLDLASVSDAVAHQVFAKVRDAILPSAPPAATPLMTTEPDEAALKREERSLFTARGLLCGACMCMHTVRQHAFGPRMAKNRRNTKIASHPELENVSKRTPFHHLIHPRRCKLALQRRETRADRRGLHRRGPPARAASLSPTAADRPPHSTTDTSRIASKTALVRVMPARGSRLLPHRQRRRRKDLSPPPRRRRKPPGEAAAARGVPEERPGARSTPRFTPSSLLS